MASSNTIDSKSCTAPRLNVEREIVKFIRANPGKTIPKVTEHIQSTFSPGYPRTRVMDKVCRLINMGRLRGIRDPITDKITGLAIEDISKYYKNLGLPESKWVTPK